MKQKVLLTVLFIFFTASVFFIYDNVKAQTNIIETLSEKRKSEYKIREKEETIIENIDFLNDFYSDIADKDIRNISMYYTTKEAIDDKCLVMGLRFYNRDSFEKFKDDINEKNDSFIRIIRYSDEGDMIITDLKYIARDNKIYSVTDYTRDLNSEKVLRTIIYNSLEEIEYLR